MTTKNTNNNTNTNKNKNTNNNYEKLGHPLVQQSWNSPRNFKANGQAVLVLVLGEYENIRFSLILLPVHLYNSPDTLPLGLIHLWRPQKSTNCLTPPILSVHNLLETDCGLPNFYHTSPLSPVKDLDFRRNNVVML